MFGDHRKSAVISLILSVSLIMADVLPSFGGELLSDAPALMEEEVLAAESETADAAVSDAAASEMVESIFPEDETEGWEDTVYDDVFDLAETVNDDLSFDETFDGIFEDDDSLLDGFADGNDEERLFAGEVFPEEEGELFEDEEDAFGDIFAEESIYSEDDYAETEEEFLIEAPEETLFGFADFDLSSDQEEETELPEEFLVVEEESEEEALFDDEEEETELVSDALMLMAEDEITTDKTGTCGEYCEWVLEQEREGEYSLIISSTEEKETVVMDDYSLEEPAPWAAYKENIYNIKVGDGISNIGDYAFYDHTSLTEVELGSSIQLVGAYAFANDKSIAALDFPDNVMTFSEGCFFWCDELTELGIRNEIQEASGRIFEDQQCIENGKRKTVYINCGYFSQLLDWLKGYERYGTNAGINIILSDGYGVCWGICGTDCIWRVTEGHCLNIEHYDFLSADMYNYENTGVSSWYNLNDKIDSVSIHDAHIWDYAFSGMNFTDLFISGLVTVECHSFADTSNLRNITIGSGSRIDFGQSLLPMAPAEELPRPQRTIRFMVQPGEGSDEGGASNDYFYYASWCVSNQDLYKKDDIYFVCEGVDNKCGENASWSISGDGTLTIEGYGEMYDYDESNPPWLDFFMPGNGYGLIKKVIVGPEITHIGERTFAFCECDNVVFNEGLESIGAEAFWECALLEDNIIIIPSTVTEIGDRALYFCSGNTVLKFMGPVPQIGENVFANAGAPLNILVPFDNGWTEETIKDQKSYLYNICFDTAYPTEININWFYADPDSSCGDHATWKLSFDGELIIEGWGDIKKGWRNEMTASIVKVTFPSSDSFITGIGADTFAECVNLKEIDIPTSVGRLNIDAFRDCESLTSLKILPTLSLNGTWKNVSEKTDFTVLLYRKSKTEDFCKEKGIPYEYIPYVSFISDVAQDRVNETAPTIVNGDPYGSLPFYLGYLDYSTGDPKVFLGWFKKRDGGEAVTAREIVDLDAAPVLFAHWREWDGSSLSKLTYEFNNSNVGFEYPDNYLIGYDSYQLILGNSRKTKTLCLQQKGWVGNCFGMCASSLYMGMGNRGSGIGPSDFRKGAEKPKDLTVNDTNKALNNITLRTFIEAWQVSQFDSNVQTMLNKNKNDLNGLCSYLKSSDFTEPVVITLLNKNGGGHALLGYVIEDLNEKDARLYVYDCNYPESPRYISLTFDSRRREYIGWTYESNSYSDISYLPFETFLNLWKNRGNSNTVGEAIAESTLDTYELYDESGNLVANVRDGEVSVGTAYQNEAFEMIILDGDTAGENNVMLRLPADRWYTLVNKEYDPTRSFEVSLVDVDSLVEISTTASEITLMAHDGSGTTGASVKTNKGDSFRMSLCSDVGNTAASEIVVEGTGNGDGTKYSIKQEGQKITPENLVESTITIDGRKRASFLVTPKAGKGGTLSPAQKTELLNGESQTYTIKADRCYAISDVKVDGKSVGKVSSYTIKNIDKNKTITAEFVEHHSFGNWKTTQAATVLKTGKKERVCSVCGKKETGTIAKLKAKIKPNAASVVMQVGQTTKGLKVTMGKGDYITKVKSSNKKVVKVAIADKKKGKIKLKALKKGTAKVTIRLKSGKKTTVKVKVQKSAVKTSKIKVGAGKKVSLGKKKKKKLAVSLKPFTSQNKITYKSSNPKVATVSKKGVVKALKPGKTKITIKSGKKKAVVTVNVKKS